MKLHEQNAGPFPRLGGLIVDLSLSYGLFYYLTSYEDFRSLTANVAEQFKGGSGLLGHELFPTILIVFLLGQMIRFYGTLIFGVSLGQWIMGIRGASPFIWNRVGGGGRVFIETLFGPFLLLDLPILAGNISFKEKFSMTRLVHRRGLIPQKVRYMAVPLFLCLSFFAPMLQNLTLIDGIIVSFSRSKSEKISNQTNFDSYKYYHSNRFKMSSFTSLKDGRFILLPSFQITKKGRSKKITPYFIIYDSKNNSDGYFKIKGTVPLLDVLENGKKGNPLFDSKYKELGKILGEKRSLFEKRDYQEKFNKRTLINRLGKEEIESLIQTSFELSYKSMLTHLLRNGPFIRGYVEVRNKLLSIADRNPTPEVDIVQMGAHKFLRLRQTLEKERLGQKPYTETLLPVTTHNALLYEFGWDKTIQDAISRRDFRESFFGVVDWYFDYKDVFKFPEKLEDFKSVQILDFFTRSNLTDEQQVLMEQFVGQYYGEIVNTAVIEKDDKLGRLLKACLNRLYLVAKIKNRNKKKFSEAFFNTISELKAKIQNGQDELMKY